MESWCSRFTKKPICLLLGESMLWLSCFDRLVLSDTAQACTIKNQDWQVGNKEISLHFPLNQLKWKSLSSISRNWFLHFNAWKKQSYMFEMHGIRIFLLSHTLWTSQNRNSIKQLLTAVLGRQNGLLPLWAERADITILEDSSLLYNKVSSSSIFTFSQWKVGTSGIAPLIMDVSCQPPKALMISTWSRIWKCTTSSYFKVCVIFKPLSVIITTICSQGC